MIIIGADFHPEFQQIALVDTDTGEFQEKRLGHPEEAEKFYRALAGQKVRVGMEASGHARWFERLLAELNFELWIGDAAVIRTKRVQKQKTDRQDAQLILKFNADRRSGCRAGKIGICGNCCGTNTGWWQPSTPTDRTVADSPTEPARTIPVARAPLLLERQFSFSFGPCTQVFVSEMHMDRLDRICFQGVCLDGNGSFLTVDIRQYDQMEIGEVEVPALAGRPALARRTEVTLSDCAMGTSLEISDAPMNFTQVLHRSASGTA
jgi:hypothetical protein